VERTPLLQAVEARRIERARFMGAPELGPSRLVAVRRPEAVVNARRRSAQKQAKNTGSLPTKAPVHRWAGHRVIRPVPSTLWQTATVVTGEPRRWHMDLLFPSWQSSRP
jgi:hypothetical protein